MIIYSVLEKEKKVNEMFNKLKERYTELRNEHVQLIRSVSEVCVTFTFVEGRIRMCSQVVPERREGSQIFQNYNSKCKSCSTVNFIY